MIERRTLLASGLAVLAGPALAQESPSPTPPPMNDRAPEYSHDEIVNRVSDFLGVTAESAGGALERVF